MNAQSNPHQGSALRHADLEAIRHQRHRSMLLFITDKCPVGCTHCSVDSRPDSATIENVALFEDIIAWMAAQPKLEVIGISGGEPFVERRGLAYASDAFAAAGKAQVIFTSGVWAKSKTTPKWIEAVLARCNSVYLSTDSFHANNISDKCFVRAINTIVSWGCWLIIQVIDQDGMRQRSEKLLTQALGEDYADYAEINATKALARGRGKVLFFPTAKHIGHSLGPCPMARSPMIRYDGKISACCNESVIMGLGPQQLRRTVASSTQLSTAMAELETDPMLNAIAGAGAGMLTMHPRFADFAQQSFTNTCQLCWKMLDRQAAINKPDHLLSAISTLKTSL